MQERFIVPQFIDIEDKIIGPVTVRQFVIIIVGGLLIFAASKLADFGLFIFEAVIIASLVLLFAFIKVNGAPFHIFFLNFIQTFKKPKIRIWLKRYVEIKEYEKVDNQDTGFIPRKNFLPTNKLSELSLIIDTGGIYKGEQVADQINQTAYQQANYSSR